MSVVTETIIQDSTFGNKLDALTAKLNGTNYTPPAADSNSGTTLVEPILTDETFSAKMDTLTGTLVPLATKADTTALELTDKKLRYLSELTKGQVWDTENGTTPAYSHTVAAGAKCVAVNMIGGKTLLFNQLCEIKPASGQITSNNDGSYTIGNVAQNSHILSIANLSGRTGHKYFVSLNPSKNLVSKITYYFETDTYLNKVDFTSANQDGVIYTPNAVGTCQVSITDFADFNDTVIYPQLFDLTQMFGAGNEPATVAAFRAMFPNDYYPYSAGSLVSADVTGVDSKDSDSVSLGSLAIPQALRTAYPLHSAGSVYDEYDIARKKFMKRVGTVDLGTLTWQRITWTNVPIFLAQTPPADAKEYSGAKAVPNILCGIYETKTGEALNNASSDKCINLCSGYFSPSGTGGKLAVVDNAYSDAAAFTAAVSGVTLYYELATPTETDISQYISDDNLLTVEAGGTLTFTQNGTALSIPNGTEYAVKLEEATT